MATMEIVLWGWADRAADVDEGMKDEGWSKVDAQVRHIRVGGSVEGVEICISQVPWQAVLYCCVFQVPSGAVRVRRVVLLVKDCWAQSCRQKYSE